MFVKKKIDDQNIAGTKKEQTRGILPEPTLKTADLFTFTKKIFIGKLHLLCSAN